MNPYGRYTVCYEPSDDPAEYLRTSIQMSISSEATLRDMAAFFTDFLRASGYIFDGTLEVVNDAPASSQEEYEAGFDWAAVAEARGL